MNSIQLSGFAGFFTRLGLIEGEFNRAASVYGSGFVNGWTGIWAQYASSDQAAVTPLPAAATAYAGTPTSYLSTLSTLGAATALAMESDVNTVSPNNANQAYLQIIQQMRTAPLQTVQRPTLGSTVTAAGTNAGNGTVFVSTQNAYGDPLDAIFAETCTVTVTSAASAFAESLQSAGQASVLTSAYNWPQGSGSSFSFAFTNPATTTLVTDGIFAAWTGTGSNTPVNWTILNGTAGVNVTQGPTGLRGLGFNAQIVSDGSSDTQLGQAVQLTTNTVYAFAVQVKTSASDGSGQFSITLTNGAGTVLQDSAGNNLQKTFNMSAQVTTSFQTLCAFFSTPRQLPATVFIQYGFTTAPAAAKFLSLSLAAGVAAGQLYAQGPFVAAFSNTLQAANGDTYSLVFTNTAPNKGFVRGSQRALSLTGIGAQYYWPSNVSPTISDTLVSN